MTRANNEQKCNNQEWGAFRHKMVQMRWPWRVANVTTGAKVVAPTWWPGTAAKTELTGHGYFLRAYKTKTLIIEKSSILKRKQGAFWGVRGRLRSQVLALRWIRVRGSSTDCLSLCYQWLRIFLVEMSWSGTWPSQTREWRSYSHLDQPQNAVLDTLDKLQNTKPLVRCGILTSGWHISIGIGRSNHVFAKE